MKRNKLGKFSEDAKNAEELALEKEKGEEERAKTFKVGDRCETSVPKQAKRHGVVMYIGTFNSYNFNDVVETGKSEVLKSASLQNCDCTLMNSSVTILQDNA